MAKKKKTDNGKARRDDKTRKNQKSESSTIRKHKRLLVVAISGIVTAIIICAIIILFSKVIIPQDKYGEAMSLISSKQYSEACQILAELGNYKDSQGQLETYSVNVLKKARVGDIAYWGKYEQNNILSDGPEVIAWKVMAIIDGKLMLLADRILDVKPYNEKMESVTWETCTLRNWLNSDFYDLAFSIDEQESICMKEVQNNKNNSYEVNGGNDTKDKIFVLSIDEAKNYFLNDERRVAKETRFAKKQGVSSKFYFNGGWLLRTPGSDSTMAAIIGMKGAIGEDGEIWEDGTPVFHGLGIRPAFWIDLSSRAIK